MSLVKMEFKDANGNEICLGDALTLAVSQGQAGAALRTGRVVKVTLEKVSTWIHAEKRWTHQEEPVIHLKYEYVHPWAGRRSLITRRLSAAECAARTILVPKNPTTVP